MLALCGFSFLVQMVNDLISDTTLLENSKIVKQQIGKLQVLNLHWLYRIC